MITCGGRQLNLEYVQAVCSSYLTGVIDSYFSGRIIRVSSKYDEVTYSMKKGCPQVFIIGPAAWCWTMDTLLNNIEAEFDQDDVETIAYADDLILFIKANSMREVERLGSRSFGTVGEMVKIAQA